RRALGRAAQLDDLVLDPLRVVPGDRGGAVAVGGRGGLDLDRGCGREVAGDDLDARFLRRVAGVLLRTRRRRRCLRLGAMRRPCGGSLGTGGCRRGGWGGHGCGTGGGGRRRRGGGCALTGGEERAPRVVDGRRILPILLVQLVDEPCVGAEAVVILGGHCG